jgi:hypothetical protein
MISAPMGRVSGSFDPPPSSESNRTLHESIGLSLVERRPYSYVHLPPSLPCRFARSSRQVRAASAAHSIRPLRLPRTAHCTDAYALSRGGIRTMVCISAPVYIWLNPPNTAGICGVKGLFESTIQSASNSPLQDRLRSFHAEIYGCR